jgi:hypothetical protein
LFDEEPVNWKGKQLFGSFETTISAGQHILIAEGEFDYQVSRFQYEKLYVYDQDSGKRQNPAKRIYVSNLSRTFTFLAGRKYNAEIVLNARNEYMLYIWDDRDFPR